MLHLYDGFIFFSCDEFVSLVRVPIMKVYIIISLLAVINIRVLADDNRRITRIEHRGLVKTEPSTVNYYLLQREGNFYNPDLWPTEKNLLMDLDIFADVDLIVTYRSDGVELIYTYKELPAYIFYPAMKRTDQDGLLLGPGITLTNIFGMGIHQEIISRYTAVPVPMRAKEFLSYTRIPALPDFPFYTELTVNYFESYNTLKLFDERSVYAECSMIYKLNRDLKFKVEATSFSVRHDSRARVFSAGGKSAEMFLGDGVWDFVPSLGAGVIFDTREREMNPHRGIYNELLVSVYGERLGGDGNFTEYLYDMRGYIPAGDSHILHVNLLAQYRPGTIPAYELYHIGGVNTLRTYSPDPSICGQHEILWTIEYRYELFANRQISLLDINGYYGIQFVLGMDNAHYWFPGVGLHEGGYLNSFFAGVHLLVPVLERVRLEFGLHGPYNDRNEIRFGIDFGWYEKACDQRRRVR